MSTTSHHFTANFIRTLKSAIFLLGTIILCGCTQVYYHGNMLPPPPPLIQDERLEPLLESGGYYFMWAKNPEAADKQYETAKRIDSSNATKLLQQTSKVPPSYPLKLAKDKITGFVAMDVLVNVDGEVTLIGIKESEPHGCFDASTIHAVKQWKYSPVTDNGTPVDFLTELIIKFDL